MTLDCHRESRSIARLILRFKRQSTTVRLSLDSLISLSVYVAIVSTPLEHLLAAIP